MGELEILALRQRAMDRLGPKFQIKRFHNLVLRNGAVPLGILERLVDEWIVSEARAPESSKSAPPARRAPKPRHDRAQLDFPIWGLIDSPALTV